MCSLSGGVQVGSRGGVIVAYHEDIRAMRMFKGPSVQNYLRQQCAPLVFPISWASKRYWRKEGFSLRLLFFSWNWTNYSSTLRLEVFPILSTCKMILFEQRRLGRGVEFCGHHNSKCWRNRNKISRSANLCFPIISIYLPSWGENYQTVNEGEAFIMECLE